MQIKFVLSTTSTAKKPSPRDWLNASAMGIFATKNKPKLSREAMLNSRPARNDALKWEENDEGEVQIRVTRQDSWKIRLLSRMFYIPKERKITLDELGTQVWTLCDGKNTVGQMIETLSKKYQLNRKAAEVSLLNYLKTLGQKRFVGFLLEGGEKSRGSGGGSGEASGKKWKR